MARTTSNYTFNAAVGAAATGLMFKGLSDSLTGAGLVRTADTGQVNWSTSVDGAGYEILRFADASQTAAPLYLRVRYVPGTHAAPTNGGVYAAVGTGTDGAGTLTGTTCPEMRLTNWSGVAANATGPTYARVAYGSHGEGYLTWMFDVSPTLTTGADCPGMLTVERFRNADGGSATDGFNTWHMTRVSDTASNWQGGYSRTVGDLAPPGQDWDPHLVVPNLANANSFLSGGAFQAFPALTVGAGARGASKAFLGGFAVDFPRNAEIIVSLYGGQMTYRSYSGLVNIPLAVQTASATWGTPKNFCPILRWE